MSFFKSNCILSEILNNPQKKQNIEIQILAFLLKKSFYHFFFFENEAIFSCIKYVSLISNRYWKYQNKIVEYNINFS